MSEEEKVTHETDRKSPWKHVKLMHKGIILRILRLAEKAYSKERIHQKVGAFFAFLCLQEKIFLGKNRQPTLNQMKSDLFPEMLADNTSSNRDKNKHES